MVADDDASVSGVEKWKSFFLYIVQDKMVVKNILAFIVADWI